MEQHNFLKINKFNSINEEDALFNLLGKTEYRVKPNQKKSRKSHAHTEADLWGARGGGGYLLKFCLYKVTIECVKYVTFVCKKYLICLAVIV